MLQHYVFLKYREGTSASHISAFRERMLALRGTIAEIRSLEVGVDEVHDARSWDVVLIMAFESLDAPVVRVCTAEVPIPYPKHLEDAAVPQPASILAALKQVTTAEGGR